MVATEFASNWIDGSALSARTVVDRAGWRVSIRALSCDAASIRSVLVPRKGGRFTVVVNGALDPTLDEIDWLIAHEIAHSLFYTSADIPQRRFRWQHEEEEFCDEFASALQSEFGLHTTVAA